MLVSPIKCLIIDDDPFIKELLKDKLQQHVPEAEILATADSGTQGLELIRQYQPELIFLDVEMLDMTGFEMLAKLEEITFQTIFITSYSHYAIKAIRFNALDYLVKPIDLGELKAAIKRYRENISQPKQREKIQQALINLNSKKVADQTLILQTQDGEMRLPLKHIVRLQGDRNYSVIYLTGGKKKMASKTLSDLEELLDDKGFFRCHKSHLINYQHIESLPNSFSVLLSDNVIVPISRRKKKDFQIWMEGIGE